MSCLSLFRTAIVVVVALSGACGGGDDDDMNPGPGPGPDPGGEPDAGPQVVCGDSVCATSEYCDTCAADCGECPCIRGNCTGEEICVGDSCESAFGRVYEISFLELSLPTSTCYDGSCGAPDPYVGIYLNGDYIGGGAEQSDTYEASWPDVVAEEVIPAGSTLEFDVWDSDFSDDDWIGGCVYEPLGAEVLRYGIISCEFDWGSLSALIDPK